ncbi:PaaI family thioesterase [Iodidimonas sp. SYSU 1G8]|uniref:PaaI family thioesterase n=1 Tax=Iodidimonas sp. SYSU 1G8 TaxID=3133967 RepID=UPI0031FE83C4
MTQDDKFLRMIQSQKFLDRIPHMGALGVQLVDFAPGQVTIRLPYNQALIGNPDTGVLAGGAISAVLDNVCGSAVVARVVKTEAFATLDLRIDYMRPAEPGRDVFAFAECYKVTRRVAFVRGYAYHDDRAKPIANATATFMFTGKGELPQAKDA